MQFYLTTDADLVAVAAFVNAAYRGNSSRLGWTTKAAYLDGQRTDAAALRADLAAQPEAMLLTLRDAADGPLLGSVWLESAEPGVWYLGMLTICPDLQGRRLGRALLAEAETVAQNRGARRVRMTVINIRDALIAWYVRRGYELTGETRPFPYGDNRFGEPRRDDLKFVVLEKLLRD
ncbi:MAG: GNAT family N-acetyltransferase [Alphaproteobacteria bacterium]|nr:GNAT family N-acetyltransferase [Alphaproteobacteria bacterium]